MNYILIIIFFFQTIFIYKESCSFKLQLDTFLLDKINSSLCYNFLDKFYG